MSAVSTDRQVFLERICLGFGGLGLGYLAADPMDNLESRIAAVADPNREDRSLHLIQDIILPCGLRISCFQTTNELVSGRQLQ